MNVQRRFAPGALRDVANASSYRAFALIDRVVGAVVARREVELEVWRATREVTL